MNSYAKVRAPNTNKSRSKNDKPEAKQTEISINFKQPIKISRPSIEQPKIRVNHAPSVVHIIERKANKVQQPKVSAHNGRVHVIQPSAGKKGWKFNMNDDISDQHSEEHIKSEHSNHKLQNILIQEPKYAQIVHLIGIEESLIDQKDRKTYQRRLQRVSISQSIQKSQQSIMQQSSVHHLDFGEKANQLDSIDIQSIVEIYRDADKQNLHRNLAYNQEWIPKSGAGIRPDSILDENSLIQISQLNEQSNIISDKIKLKRNIILQKLNESRSSFSSRKSMIVIQDEESGIRQIIIPDELQEKYKQNMLQNQQRRFWVIDHEIMKEKSQIVIVQDYQQSESKRLLPNHRRIMNHNQVLYDEKEIKVQSIPKQELLLQKIKLESIHEASYDDKKSSKLTRKLLIIQDNEGKQKIQVPELFEQSKHENLLINHRRIMNYNQISQQQPIKVQTNLIKHPISQKIEVISDQEKLNDDRKLSKISRRLLIVQDKDGSLISRQIQIPEQLQQTKGQKRLQNHKRAINHAQIASGEPIKIQNSPKLLQNQEIQVQQIEEMWGSGKQSSKLSRKLLVLQDKNYNTLVQQVLIPQQFQLSYGEKHYSNLRRERKLIQRKQQGLKDTNIVIQAENENYHSGSNSKVLMARNLLLIKAASGKELYQQVIIPEQFQIKQAKISNISYKRQINHQALAQSSAKVGRGVPSGNFSQAQYQQIVVPSEQQSKSGQRLAQSHKRMMKHLETQPPSIDAPINQEEYQSIVHEYAMARSVQIQPIFEDFSSSNKQNKQMRNLLVIQDSSGKVSAQEIIIPEQFSQNLGSKQSSLQHKRQFKIIQFQDEPKINQRPFESSVSHARNLVVNPIQQGFESSKRSQKITRNLLAIKNNNGQTLYQEIFLPEEQELKSGQNGINNHKRQFKIIQIQEKHIKIAQNIINSSQIEGIEEQGRPQKLNSHPFHAQEAQQDPIIIENIHEDHENRYESSVKQKYKRALLLVRDEPGKVQSQQISIPHEQYQTNNNQKCNITYQRNIKLQNSVDVHAQGVEKEPQNLPQKSFNPSTLNSSSSPNINLVASSLQQSNIPAQHRPLARLLSPSPEKLYNSEQTNSPFKKFDVYKPRSYFDNRLSLSQPAPLPAINKPLKSFRRPGFHAQQ